jgi:hypothetical protein
MSHGERTTQSAQLDVGRTEKVLVDIVVVLG